MLFYPRRNGTSALCDVCTGRGACRSSAGRWSLVAGRWSLVARPSSRLQLRLGQLSMKQSSQDNSAFSIPRGYCAMLATSSSGQTPTRHLPLKPPITQFSLTSTSKRTPVSGSTPHCLFRLIFASRRTAQ